MHGPIDSSQAAAAHPRRPPRWVALGFTLAFGSSVLTVIYTGLLAREAARGPAGVPRTLTLELSVQEALEDALLSVELPPQVQLVEPPVAAGGAWRATLARGANWLPMTLRGEARWIDLRVRHAGRERWFTIDERNTVAVRTGDLPVFLAVRSTGAAPPEGAPLALRPEAQ